jgi:AbrB family looped-hinge helix DNA binding protein
MATTEMLMTTVSTKGQVILPKAIRQRRNWEPGTRLVVEDTPDGVLLRAAPLFAPTRPEDVAGMLPYRGPPKTLEEMDAAVTAEVTRRRDRRGEDTRLDQQVL